MKTICNEFTVKNYFFGTPKGEKTPLIDITFTPIYELIFNEYKMYFKTFELRKQAIEFLINGITAPNSTFEYIEGFKVYTKLLK